MCNRICSVMGLLAVLVTTAGCASASFGPDESTASEISYSPELSRLTSHLIASRGTPEDSSEYARFVRVIESVEPRYPREALIRCRSGWVLLEFLVDDAGNARDIQILAQYPERLFGRSAVSALGRWTFERIGEEGSPSTKAVQPIEFAVPEGCTDETQELSAESVSLPAHVPVHALDGIGEAMVAIWPELPSYTPDQNPFLVFRQKWDAGDSLDIDLRRVMSNLVFQLRGWDTIEEQEGIETFPDDAKFSRMQPIAGSLDGKEAVAAYFTDAADRNLALFYVDQAMTWSQKRAAKGLPQFDLSFPGRGFYWIEFRPMENGEGEEAVRTTVDSLRMVLRNFPEN